MEPFTPHPCNLELFPRTRYQVTLRMRPGRSMFDLPDGIDSHKQFELGRTAHGEKWTPWTIIRSRAQVRSARGLQFQERLSRSSTGFTCQNVTSYSGVTRGS